MKYGILSDYYFDIDSRNQFRLTGPNNHLLLGFSIFHQSEVNFGEAVIFDEHVIQLTLEFEAPEVTISQPLVCNIRTLRKYTEGSANKPSYLELASQKIAELLPQVREFVSYEQINSDSLTLPYQSGKVLRLSRTYRDFQGEENTYGANVIFPQNCTVTQTADTLTITNNDAQPVEFVIESNTKTVPSAEKIEQILYKPLALDPGLFSETILRMVQEVRRQVHFLVSTSRTSSFEFGTIFPRDWIESALLGEKDLTHAARDFMVEQSMKHLKGGEGWHEEVIGEYRNFVGKDEWVDRKMVDIEPLYILSLNTVSKQFLLRESNQEKFQAVAEFLINKAEKNEHITFKEIQNEPGAYYKVGNWRDSEDAFYQHEQPLAPYDVNCVFYPEALRTIWRFREMLHISQTRQLRKIMRRWASVHYQYLLTEPLHIQGYALALHGNPLRTLKIAHIDEGYALFYGQPSLEDVVSFAKRMMSPKYFYTPVGPILVSQKNPYLDERHYHGKVIWPKQAAFAIAGMAKQYRKGMKYSWPEVVMDTLYQSITLNCEASLRGFEQLEAIPELYYYDRDLDKARFYVDQEAAEGQMSLLQLWSAVGFLRIVREYAAIKKLQV